MLEENPPLVSVVIPTYNSAATIEETLQSVLAQTFPDFEVVIADDGSTDETTEIVRRIADHRIKLHSLKRVTHIQNRNRSIELAKGTYIALLDSDDVWLPEKLRSHVEALEAHPDAVAAYGWLDYIDENSAPLFSANRIVCNGDAYQSLILTNWLETASNIFARRDVMIATGGFDTSLSHCADWDMGLKLARAGDFVCIPEVMTHYRRQDSSLSANLQGTEESFIKLLDREYANPAPSLQSREQDSLLNAYEALMLRSVFGVIPIRSMATWSLGMIWRAVKKDPRFLLRIIQRPWVTRAFLKILAGAVLPSVLTHKLRSYAASGRHS